MDRASTWIDIALGLLIAGPLAAWLPKEFWQAFFLSADQEALARQSSTAHHSNMRAHIATKPAPSPLPELEDRQIAELAELLRLLGEPTRLRILLACLAEPASVGEIAARVNIPRSLVSHHLRMLRASRFLRSTRNGKQIIYSPVDDRVRCILEDLVGHVVEPPDEKDHGQMARRDIREIPKG
jgi:DNA-binding transcriptional ArsR family regulator